MSPGAQTIDLGDRIVVPRGTRSARGGRSRPHAATDSDGTDGHAADDERRTDTPDEWVQRDLALEASGSRGRRSK